MNLFSLFQYSGIGEKSGHNETPRVRKKKEDLTIADLTDITSVPMEVVMEKYQDLIDKGYKEKDVITFLLTLDELYLGRISQKEAVRTLSHILGSEQDSMSMLTRAGYI